MQSCNSMKGSALSPNPLLPSPKQVDEFKFLNIYLKYLKMQKGLHRSLRLVFC